MAVERERAISPGNSRLPKCIVDPLNGRDSVSPEYPTTLCKNCKVQTNDTEELDLINEHPSGWPSFLSPPKVAALRTIKENRPFTPRQVSVQLKENGQEHGSETMRLKKEGAGKGGSPHQAVCLYLRPRRSMGSILSAIGY